VTLFWITNWLIQSHWHIDDARRVRIWKRCPSIWGPYWLRDWGTLPHNDTNSSSWVSNHALPEQKSTSLTLQKLAGRTLRVNGIRWPEKQTLRHSINNTTKTNTVGRAPFWFHFSGLISSSVHNLSPFTIQIYAHPLITPLRIFHNYDPWDYTMALCLSSNIVLISIIRNLH
jgi:hypothetical protein